MRRSLAASMLLALPVVALAAVPAQAAPGHGATITKGKSDGGFCFQSLVGYNTTTDFVSVITPSGNVTLTCHFDDIAYSGKKALKLTDFSCSTYAGGTTDTSLVVTPSGNGTLVCKIKK
jgi:hypothetical protein